MRSLKYEIQTFDIPVARVVHASRTQHPVYLTDGSLTGRSKRTKRHKSQETH